ETQEATDGFVPAATAHRRAHGRHGSLLLSHRPDLCGIRYLLLLAHLHQGRSGGTAGASGAHSGHRFPGGSLHSRVCALECRSRSAAVRDAAAELSAAVSPRAAGTTVAALAHSGRRQRPRRTPGSPTSLPRWGGSVLTGIGEQALVP